jgi:hypothetical protein
MSLWRAAAPCAARATRRFSSKSKSPLSAEQKKWQNSEERVENLRFAERGALGFGALSMTMLALAWWYTDGFNKSFAIGSPPANPESGRSGKYDPE